MTKYKNGREKQNEMTYTYMPVLKIIILLCILTIIIMAAGGLAIAFQRMKKEAAPPMKMLRPRFPTGWRNH